MTRNYSLQNILFFSVLYMIQIQLLPAQSPPVASVREVVDTHWGVEVSDPYRYLEDLENEEVKRWIKGQADYTRAILDNIPGRDALLERLKELDEGKPYRIYSIKLLPEGNFFYMKRHADEDLYKLYYLDAKTGKETVLMDPEKLEAENGQHYSLNFYSTSPDNKYVAYGLAKGGSERATIHILDISTGKNLPETIDRIETAYNKPQWLPDSKSFFYCRRQKLPEDAPATEIYKNTKTYLHVLETNPDEDKVVFAKDLSSAVELKGVDFPSLYRQQEAKFVVGKIKHGDAREITLYSAPLESIGKTNIPWKNICKRKDGVTTYAVHGNDIYMLTHMGAPRYKVIRTSLENPDFSKAEVIMPESEMVIERISPSKAGLFIGVMDGGFQKIFFKRYGEKSKPQQVVLPDGAAGYVVSANVLQDRVLIKSSSWTEGSIIYSYNPNKQEFTDSGLEPTGKFDHVAGYQSIEVKVKSHDGVMVPLSIIHKKGIELKGQNPTLLSGYGSYGSSRKVYFNPLRFAWLERGGILAIAHVRGGGEYGKEWHLAGQKLNKPNTWKDFIACAEYLIEKGYTSTPYLAGQGGSAGGILLGRTITERPDLLQAAIINVGALDMVRAETTTNGVPNIQEFGTFTKEDEFRGLYEMSAYHHVQDGETYPAVMLTHGINDPRVEPWTSAKMTARLQAASSSGKPVIFRVSYSEGHGIGSTRTQYLERLADQYAFLLWQFGIEAFQPKKGI